MRSTAWYSAGVAVPDNVNVPDVKEPVMPNALVKSSTSPVVVPTATVAPVSVRLSTSFTTMVPATRVAGSSYV